VAAHRTKWFKSFASRIKNKKTPQGSFLKNVEMDYSSLRSSWLRIEPNGSNHSLRELKIKKLRRGAF